MILSNKNSGRMLGELRKSGRGLRHRSRRQPDRRHVRQELFLGAQQWAGELSSQLPTAPPRRSDTWGCGKLPGSNRGCDSGEENRLAPERETSDSAAAIVLAHVSRSIISDKSAGSRLELLKPCFYFLR